MPDLVAAFEHAAATHERSAALHERAAAFFAEHGKPEAAARELEFARKERGGAVEDRERARQRREWLKRDAEAPSSKQRQAAQIDKEKPPEGTRPATTGRRAKTWPGLRRVRQLVDPA